MNRPERLEDQIHFLLSNLIQREVRDPSMGFVTLTAVRITQDKGIAKVYYTVMGDEAQQKATEKALGRATGFLRTQLASRLKLKRVPELRFFLDETLEESAHIEGLFAKIHAEEAARPQVEAPEAGAETGEGE